MVLTVILCTTIVVVLNSCCIVAMKQTAKPETIIKALSWLTSFYVGLMMGVLFTFIFS